MPDDVWIFIIMILSERFNIPFGAAIPLRDSAPHREIPSLHLSFWYLPGIPYARLTVLGSIHRCSATPLHLQGKAVACTPPQGSWGWFHGLCTPSKSDVLRCTGEARSMNVGIAAGTILNLGHLPAGAKPTQPCARC